MSSRQYKGCIFIFLSYFVVKLLKFFYCDLWQEIHMYTHTTPPHTNETKTVKQYLSVTSYVFVCFFFYIFSSLFLLLKQILCKPLNELHNVAIARKPRFYRLGIMLQGGFPKTRESDKHISLHFCSQPSTCVACHIRKSKFL